MGWFGPSGDCGCCGLDCTTCTNPFTAVTISGLTHGVCTTGCSNGDGIYIVRSSGDPIPGNCTWTRGFMAAYNCALFSASNVYITGFCSCNSSLQVSNLSVQLVPSGSGLLVKVSLSCDFCDTITAGGPYFTKHTSLFTRTAATCGDITGSLTFDSSTSTALGGCTNNIGDFCGFDAATVTLT